MKIGISEKVKNEKGSSLAFVLIIGMIIMIMVASLLAVANSGLTFTQQSVESRQAYIDAKSVIEFGKIEIKARKEWLEVKNSELKVLYQNLAAAKSSAAAASIQRDIDALSNEINSHMTAPYYIGSSGAENNVALNLKEVATATDALGVLEVTPTQASETNLMNFKFKIDTQNLRRDLNYEVGLDYQAANLSEANGNIPKIPDDASDAWLDTKIVPKENKGEIQCVIQKSGNQKAYDLVSDTLTVHVPDDSLDVGKDKANANDNNIKFGWLQEKKLDLLAKNICFSAPFPTAAASVYKSQFTIQAADELRFKQDYIQSSNAGLTNTLAAENIVFEKNLVINNNDKLVITCKNLWINGDVLVNALNGTNSSVTINADNIIVGDYTKNTGGNIKIGDRSKIDWNCANSILIRGNIDFLTNVADPENQLTAKNISIGTKTNNNSVVTIKNASKIIWNCENFWLHGNMTTITSGSYQEFNNIVYFEAGNINLSNNCKLFVTGKTNSANQIFVGGIIPLESNAYTVKIKNFELLQCNGDFGLTQSSLLELEALNVLIKGNLSLVRTGNLNINTQYFDVIGATKIDNSPFNIYGNGALNVRFNGGYEQYNSVVNITGAANVILESPIKLKYDNPPTLTLNIKADNIFLNNNSATINPSTQFKYSGKTDGSGTNLYVYPNPMTFYIDWQTSKTVQPGKYTGVTGSKLEDLSVQPASYTPPPGWPPLTIGLLSPAEPDGSGQSSGTGGTGGTVSGGSVKLKPSSEKYY